MVWHLKQIRHLVVYNQIIMSIRTYPLYVPLSSFNSTYFQVVPGSNGEDQLIFKGDSQGSFKALLATTKNNNNNEIASATFTTANFTQVQALAQSEEKKQTQPNLIKEEVEGKREPKEGEKVQELIISGTGKFSMSRMPLPPNLFVYLIVNLQMSKIVGEDYGVGLVYEYYAVNDYPPPEDFKWDAYFSPVEFVSDGEAIFDQSSNSFKLIPYRDLYFDFKKNEDPETTFNYSQLKK